MALATAVMTVVAASGADARPPRPVTGPATGGSHAERPLDPIKDAPTVEWPRRGQVALSFDDGPLESTTNQVLDVLAERGVPATFFVNCARFQHAPRAMRRMVADGHSVQNHTTNHPWLVRIPSDAVYRELDSCSTAVSRIAWERPTLFRPPYGATSPRVNAIASSLGMRVTMWNASPSSMEAGTSQVYNQIVGQTEARRQAGEGAVILLHDGSGNRSAQVEALGPIIDTLRAAGWTFVRLG